MKVKIKKLHKDAVVPTYSKQGDAGMDLTATSKTYDDDGNVVYGVGLSFEIPKGYVGLLFPRSSNAKKDLILSNSVGVLDSGYRGEVLFKFKSSKEVIASDSSNLKRYSLYSAINEYEVRDRIGQIVILPYPEIEFIEVDELSDSDRGVGGYGSTGK